MAEAYGTVPQMIRYYGESENGTVVRYGAQVPFNFALMGLSQSSKAGDFINTIKVWIDAMPNGVGIHANWVVSTFSLNSKERKKVNLVYSHIIPSSVGKPRSAKNC